MRKIVLSHFNHHPTSKRKRTGLAPVAFMSRTSNTHGDKNNSDGCRRRVDVARTVFFRNAAGIIGSTPPRTQCLTALTILLALPDHRKSLPVEFSNRCSAASCRQRMHSKVSANPTATSPTLRRKFCFTAQLVHKHLYSRRTRE